MPALPLLALLLGGCFMLHSPEDEADPDPPGEEEEDPERFLFRRGAPVEGRATFTDELHVLGVDGETTRLFELSEGAAFSVVQGRGDSVVATWSEGSGELASQVVAVPDASGFDTGYGGTPHLSEDGETIVHLTSEGIVQTAADGTELVRLEVPGSGGRVSPGQRTVMRPSSDDAGTSLTFVTLPSGGTWTGTLDATVLGPVLFTADERVVYVASMPEAHVWSAPSYSLHRVDLRTAHTVLDPLAVPAEQAIVGVDRCTDTIYLVDGAGTVLARNAGGPAEPVVTSPASPPVSLARPFAEVARLSPDGRHLVWLGNDGIVQVADLARGTSRAVDMPVLPVPSECCGDIVTEVVLGNFVDDSVSVGVAPVSLRPLCSCAPLHPAMEPMAFRVDLETATAAEVEHCGRSTPWLTRDGDMLVCREEEEEMRVRLGLASDDGFTPLTDGPWDVAAFPLEPAVGCGIAAR